MFHLIVILVLLSQSGVPIVNGANILGLMGMTSHSHHIWNSVLMHRLAEQGHNVTILSANMAKPSEKLPANIHYIYLEKAYAIYEKDMSEEKYNITALMGLNPFKLIKFVYDFGLETCKGIAASEGLQTLLNYPDDFKFDVILYDYTLGPYLLGFVHKFHYPPLVGMTPFHNPPETADAMFNHYFPAYIPHHSTAYSTEMDFWERFENTLIFIAETVYRRLVYLPQIDAVMRPYFANDMPNLRDLAEATAISLVNSHPSVNYAEPLPPNVIEVGGMQIFDAKTLPKDLDEFMNNSQKGVVFVSFGTNMKSQYFSEKQIRVILKAMSELREYNFMWKFDAKYLKGTLSQNVLVRSFFPQRDILACERIIRYIKSVLNFDISRTKTMVNSLSCGILEKR